LIAIIDYGVGNLRSVERALLQVGAQPVLTGDADLLERASGLVLPGVGAFAPALRRLEESRLGRRLVEVAKRGKPLLGVCLGYQLLFDESEEHGRHEGLGLLDGRVIEVKGSKHLPVIGWSRVHQVDYSPLWHGIADSSYFYFVHSYTPAGSRNVIGASEHSPAAAGGKANVMGTQFHPEKSGADGIRVYANFLDICGAG
jgi:glutamine amidotransferase